MAHMPLPHPGSPDGDSCTQHHGEGEMFMDYGHCRFLFVVKYLWPVGLVLICYGMKLIARTFHAEG